MEVFYDENDNDNDVGDDVGDDDNKNNDDGNDEEDYDGGVMVVVKIGNNLDGNCM